MAAAATSTVLDLTSKAANLTREISSGYYKASQAMDSFPIKLTELRQQSEMYASLLSRYGMENDPYIQLPLKNAIDLLRNEEVKAERLQDQCCLCLIGRKLLFPDSVIMALDGVIAAYKNLPEHIKERQSLAEELERSSLNKRRTLPFEHDAQYVPIEKSVREVRAALEQENSGPLSRRIVVISGGSGQGKSSMARYLACLYQDGMPNVSSAENVAEAASLDQDRISSPYKRLVSLPASSSLHPSPTSFENGVLFLRCGTNVNTKSLLVQVWQDMGFQAQILASNNQKSMDDQGEEEKMHKLLSSRLKNQRVLIILDDVWDPTMVDKLIIQGKWVKYLVTTQVSSLRNDAIEIKLSKPSMPEARNMIANYVIGYPKNISSDIEMEIGAIIEKSDYNPLVLANVATNIRDGGASQLDEWKSTQKYLADLQDGDGKRPVSLYGRSYSKRTLGASMEMALNSFSSEEQTLVFLVSMFESRPIPEVVFKLLFKSRHSSLAKFSKYSEHLERANFIEIQSAVTRWDIAPRKTWSIHKMRQMSIRKIRKKELDLMCAEMCSAKEEIAMLFVLYGEEPWNDQATRTLGIPRHQHDHVKPRSFPIPPVEPFVWLLHADTQEKCQQDSHEYAIEVLRKYLLSIENYDTSLSSLLENPQTFVGACEALYIIQSLYNSPSTTFQIQKMSINSLAILVQNLTLDPDLDNSSEFQKYAAITLVTVTTDVKENAINIGSLPNAVDTLIDLLQNTLHLEVQENAALALGYVSQSMGENDITIGSFVIERLVDLLKEGVSHEVHRSVAWALGALSQNVIRNAINIGSFPNVVERLVALLQEGVRPQVQGNAAWTLGQLSKSVVDNAIKIGSFPHAVERLVALLQQEVSCEVQQWAAWALGALSQNVVDNAIKIGSFPNAVERLVALLEQKVSPEIQEWATYTLGQLSQNVVNNAINIGSFPKALERLVALLQEGVSPNVQENAAWTLGALSENVVDNAINIGSFPNALDRLVALLQEGVSPNVQENAAWTLGQLSKNVMENAIKIRSFPSAMERLGALQEEGVSNEVKIWSGWALEQISENL